MYQYNHPNPDYVGVNNQHPSFEIQVALWDLTFSNHAPPDKVIHGTWYGTWHNAPVTSFQPWKEMHTPQLSPKKWILNKLLFIACFNIQLLSISPSGKTTGKKKPSWDGFIKVCQRRALNSTLLCRYNGKNSTHFHTEEGSYPSFFCLSVYSDCYLKW